MRNQEEMNKAIKYVAQECGVSEVVARIALEHSRWSIRIAKDLLSNQHCNRTFYREAREYGLDD